MYTIGEFSKNDFSPKRLGTRHLQIFLVFSGIALIWAGRYGISVAVVAMTDANSTPAGYLTYDWDSKERGVILSSFCWSYVIMQLPSGFIANVYSAHIYMCCLVFVSNFVNVLTPLSVYYFGWTGAVVCRVLLGIAQSGFLACGNTLVARWVPKEERSKLLPLVMAAIPVGNIITLCISGLLARSSLGWPSIFYVFGAIGMLWSVLFYFVGANSPSEHKRISFDERNYIEESLNVSTDSEPKHVKIPWKSMLTSIPFCTLIITTCCHTWGYQMFSNKLPAYMKNCLGYDIGRSGVISAMPYVALIVMAVFYSRICDFVLRHGVTLSIARKVSNTISFWGASAGLIVLCSIPADSDWLPVVILIAIFGMDAANLCGFNINHIDIAPNFAGIQVAVINGLAMIFGQTAPLVCGWIVTDETNADQWHIIFYTIAGLYFAANLIFITFGQTHAQPWNDIKEEAIVPDFDIEKSPCNSKDFR